MVAYKTYRTYKSYRSYRSYKTLSSAAHNMVGPGRYHESHPRIAALARAAHDAVCRELARLARSEQSRHLIGEEPAALLVAYQKRALEGGTAWRRRQHANRLGRPY